MQHTDPDYSTAYVVLEADSGLKGFGITFTLGRGTDIGEDHAPASRLRTSAERRTSHVIQTLIFPSLLM